MIKGLSSILPNAVSRNDCFLYFDNIKEENCFNFVEIRCLCNQFNWTNNSWKKYNCWLNKLFLSKLKILQLNTHCPKRNKFHKTKSRHRLYTNIWCQLHATSLASYLYSPTTDCPMLKTIRTGTDVLHSPQHLCKARILRTSKGDLQWTQCVSVHIQYSLSKEISWNCSYYFSLWMNS